MSKPYSASNPEQQPASLTLNSLFNCNLCPHHCGVDRSTAKRGICRSGMGFEVASVVAHKGEEPVISGEKGICNVFFRNCNLRCVFCQNFQISQPGHGYIGSGDELRQIVDKIIILLEEGCHALGFVSPSHVLPQMKIIIEEVHGRGKFPVIVYNSNGYEDLAALRSLEGIIDVYLPDFKYADERLGRMLSGVKNYPEIALQAIREMFRQKGTSLIRDEDGRAISGLIIRHLVLPSYVENSISALSMIAENLSVDVHLSLMAQYYPAYTACEYAGLDRQLTANEYAEVTGALETLGFHRGWVQELESAAGYRPDFDMEIPFQ